MSIARKLKSILLTYSFVISISINLFTTGSEAAGGPPPPPPPPPPGWTSQAASSNNTGSGGQTTQPESSKSTSSSKKTSSPTKTPEVAPPTTDLGKRYAKLIDINDRKQNLIIQFPKVIAYLIRQELTLQNLDTSTDVNKIITLFNEREDSTLDNAKKIYQEFIKDPYIAQFTNKNQQTGGFLDNKLFDESQEEATLRLLSLEQLDAQRKQEILSQQGNILEQLKFINENSEILGAYGKTASTEISKKLPKELPKILSQRGDILGQLRFIKENSEILGAYGKTASTDISKKLPKELPKILSQQGDILGQLKFINENSEILGEHSKATLKDKLKVLSKQLDKISSNQLVGFILDENKINTNLKNVPFSKKEVRELIDSLNNEILEKIFLQDDGTITEQDLTKISQKYKETDLIKNLTQSMVYIEGNKSSGSNTETLNKTLEKGLGSTTKKQRELFVNVLTSDNSRIQKVFIEKIEKERKQDENQRNLEKKGALLNDLENALKRRESRIPKQQIASEVEKQITSYQQETLAYKKQEETGWVPHHQNDDQNDDQNTNKDTEVEGWEDNNNDNNNIDTITEAFKELERAVQPIIEKNGIIKTVAMAQEYLQKAQDQLSSAEKNREEIVKDLSAAFKIIPEKEQNKIQGNGWQDHLPLEEITKLNTLNEETNTLKNKKNKSGKFTSTADASQFKAKEQEYHTLLAELQKIGIAKQQEKLVKDYVDEMISKAKNEVGKIEAILEDLKKKKENKHDNAESGPLISKEILEAQKQLKKAETVLSTAERNYELAKRRGNISNSDSDDDDSDNESDKKITPIQAREIELNDAKEKVAQAKKNLEDAEAKDAERQRQEEDEAKRKAEKAEDESLGYMASMFKNAEEEAEQKEEAERQRQEDLKRKQDEAERQRQEDLKRKQDEAERQRQKDLKRKQDEAERQRQKDLKRKQDEAERQRQKDLKRKQDEAEHQRQKDLKRKQDEAERQRQKDLKRKQDEAEHQRQKDLKRKQDEAEHQRQKDLKRKQDEANRKAAKDEATRKAEKAEAESLGYMASMFKNAEDEANKAAEDEATRKAEKAEAECLGYMASMFKNAEDEANKAAEDEAKRKADKAEAESLGYMASMFKNAEDEANKAAEEEAKRKAEKAEAECLEDMASMFKNAEDEANKAAEEEAKRKADKAEAECLEDMASMFKNAEDEAEQKAKEDAAKTKAEADRKAKKDEGYKADEEELEESNNTAEEEFKKDMLLESEDKAVNMSLKTEEIVEQDDTVLKEQISNKTNETVALLEGVDRMTSVTNKHIYSNIFNNRLNVAAIGAGDEEASINRGVWISGLYGINKQGAWKNIPKYQGRTTGVTIGGDVEFINSHDVIGIAYSRLESQVKYNKKLGKTAINGHLLSIYGLKELIKGFSLQAITSYGHNYIKNKTTSINNIIGKYQNNNVSFETLLNYKYRTKHDLHFIPSIGFKYDYSRASNYKEYNVDIENLMIQKKSNQSFESSLGGKIVFKPIATGNNIVLTPSLHGNIERHFNTKNTKVNAKATFKGQTLQQTIILPKQPKLGYNVGSNILMSRKNINVLLEYNYYTHRKYQSHQGLVKLKVNL